MKIITIGKSQYSSSDGNWTGTNDIPVLIDQSPYQTWSDWSAGQRDLFFLDVDGNYVTDFNISTWNYDNVYNTILSLLPQGLTCTEIEAEYESLHIGEYAACNYDIDCIAVWGHCDVGLGGCHYSVNEDDYPENEINSLVDQWVEDDCMQWVCDCSAEPYAQCINGTCTSAYCMSPNPAGCFQTGCSEGYECVDDPNYCVPSTCGCDGFYGQWTCTADCNGGTCQLVQLPGDMNNDGAVNVVDVVVLVDIILNNSWNSAGDINGDSAIDIVDVVLLVNIILG